MKLEPDHLERRLSRRLTDPISEQRQFRWVKEIASAASWLETFDYFHGDLRPENVLLDEAQHVKVCDFGRARKRGAKTDVATYPFYRPAKNAVAGPEHEQFAVGSRIYTIWTGQVPYGQWETPDEFRRMYDALVRGEYPPTDHDGVLGLVISSCWQARYDSMADVEAAIKRAVGVLGEGGSAATLSPEEHDVCVRTCREFIAQQGEENRGRQ